MEQVWRGVLSEKVVSNCKDRNAREADCESLVKSWVKEISSSSRPTVVGVVATATAQRKVWGMEPID